MAIIITINQINATDDEVKNLNKILPFSEKRHELMENNISFSVINQSQEFFMTNEQNKKENIEINGVIIDFNDKSKSYYCDATRANLEGLITIIPLSEYREVNLYSNYFEIYWSTKKILVAVPSNSKLPHEIKIEFKNKKWVYSCEKEQMLSMPNGSQTQMQDNFFTDEQNKAFASMRKGRQVLEATQGVEDLKK